MQDTTTARTYLKARTFNGFDVLECYGEVWSRAAVSVRFEVAAPGAPVTATVNGQPAVLEAALQIAAGLSQRTVSEERAPLPPSAAPASIGKARAHRLHILMAQAGVPSGEHYRTAARALGRGVASLAALSEGEARRVWAYLGSAYPAARALGPSGAARVGGAA